MFVSDFFNFVVIQTYVNQFGSAQFCLDIQKCQTTRVLVIFEMIFHMNFPQTKGGTTEVGFLLTL